MRTITFLLAGLLVCAAQTAQAQGTERPEDWPEGSAMRTGLLARQELEKQDKLVGARHTQLLKAATAAGADSRLLAALKNQQAAWKKYVPEECELVGARTGAGGTWPSTYAMQCELGLNDQRAKQLQEALRCVEKKVAEKQGSEIGDCLQTLTPLAGAK